MTTTKIREQIYEFIEMYVDTPEPKKLCSSIEDLVEELAESKVKKLALCAVGTSTFRFSGIKYGEKFVKNIQADDRESAIAKFELTYTDLTWRTTTELD